MKKKSALLVGLSVLSLTAAVTAASAAPANNNVVAPSTFTATALMATDSPIVNAPISGSSFTKFFNIPANFGWVKVWVYNTSSETLRVRVTQSTITGTEKMATYEVAPGQQITKYGTQPWSTGTHWVAISTKNGGAMSGFLSVKLANTKAEL